MMRTPGDHAIERHVRAAADDDVGRIVAEERGHLLVAHVVRKAARTDRPASRGRGRARRRRRGGSRNVVGSRARRARMSSPSSRPDRGERGRAGPSRARSAARTLPRSSVASARSPTPCTQTAPACVSRRHVVERLGPREAEVARDEELARSRAAPRSRGRPASASAWPWMSEMQSRRTPSSIGATSRSTPRRSRREAIAGWPRPSAQSRAGARAIPRRRRLRRAPVAATSRDRCPGTRGSSALAQRIDRRARRDPCGAAWPSGSRRHAGLAARCCSRARTPRSPRCSRRRPRSSAAHRGRGAPVARAITPGSASRLRARVGECDDAIASRASCGGSRTRRAHPHRAARAACPPSLGGADVDVTARELSALAEVTIEVALDEATLATSAARFGPPRTASGAPAGASSCSGWASSAARSSTPAPTSTSCYFYDTDDGGVRLGGAARRSRSTTSGRRVARRLTATLEDVTEDGFVWRVDLRLAPGGSQRAARELARGGRALLRVVRAALGARGARSARRPSRATSRSARRCSPRSRPSSGARRVDPAIARRDDAARAARARRALARRGARPQARPGRHPRGRVLRADARSSSGAGASRALRAQNTLDGLRRLRAAGLVTDREAREIARGVPRAPPRRARGADRDGPADAHRGPTTPEAATRLARALGFAGRRGVRGRPRAPHRRASRRAFARSCPTARRSPSRWPAAIAALERARRRRLRRRRSRARAGAGRVDATRARRGGALGRRRARPLRARRATRTRRSARAAARRIPQLAETVLDAVADAADPGAGGALPPHASSRALRHPGVYAAAPRRRSARRAPARRGPRRERLRRRRARQQPRARRRIVLFARGAPTPAIARAPRSPRRSREAARSAHDEIADEAARRRAPPRQGARHDRGRARRSRRARSARARSRLDALRARRRDARGRDAPRARHARRRARARARPSLAMGKLGGREIGYGSDLDVIFLFDPRAGPGRRRSRRATSRAAARRVIRLISVLAPGRPRLRARHAPAPLGQPGPARHVARGVRALPRLGTRRADGDGGRPHASAARRRLGAPRACSARAPPPATPSSARARSRSRTRPPTRCPASPRAWPRRSDRLRARMERELSQERRGRYDLKLGRGGLVDDRVRRAVPPDAARRATRACARPRPRVAIDALAAAGYLARRARRGAARRATRSCASSSSASASCTPTRRTCSRRARPGSSRSRAAWASAIGRGELAAGELLARYREVTARVREVYESMSESNRALSDRSILSPMALAYLFSLVVALGVLLVQIAMGGKGDADGGHGDASGHDDAPGNGAPRSLAKDVTAEGDAQDTPDASGILAFFLSLRFWIFSALGFGLSGSLLTLFGLAGPIVVFVLAASSGLVFGALRVARVSFRFAELRVVDRRRHARGGQHRARARARRQRQGRADSHRARRSERRPSGDDRRRRALHAASRSSSRTSRRASRASRSEPSELA